MVLCSFEYSHIRNQEYLLTNTQDNADLSWNDYLSSDQTQYHYNIHIMELSPEFAL